MDNTKESRRVLKSKKLIKESLLKLLETKDIHKITVTDICREAHLNRSTFYLHYENPFKLLQSMEDELFNTIFAYINESSVNKYNDKLLLKILTLIKENKDFCKILFCKQYDNRVINKLVYFANKANITSIASNSKNYDENFSNYFTMYSIGGTLSIIGTWLANDLKESPEELIEIIENIIKVNSDYFFDILDIF